jgi:glutathione synthase
MYPWENVEYKTDTTLRLIHEAFIRGHRVAITNPNNLTMRESTTSAFCKVLKCTEKVSTPQALYKKVKFTEELLPIAGFDVVFMRANPPIDQMMLNFLDSVKDEVFFINDIQGLRKANNKLYTAAFDDPNNEMVPVTHVTKNKEYLKRVIAETNQEQMILKPVNGMGGSGVIILETKATQNINSLLDFYIGSGDKSNYVMLQELIPGAENGDVRILMLNGLPIGAMRRIPAKDDMRSNVHAGGSVAKHNLTKVEKALCKKIGPKLVEDGLLFVGIDVISGKLLEVNVCSPGGITRINTLNKVKLQRQVLDFAENVVKSRNAAENRKSIHRKKVTDA